MRESIPAKTGHDAEVPDTGLAMPPESGHGKEGYKVMDTNDIA
jgi:hypothetical protein